MEVRLWKLSEAQHQLQVGGEGGDPRLEQLGWPIRSNLNNKVKRKKQHFTLHFPFSPSSLSVSSSVVIY